MRMKVGEILIVKYTLSRKSLYNGDYSDNHMDILSGNTDDKIKHKAHMSIIYKLIIYNRKKANKSAKKEEKKG